MTYHDDLEAIQACRQSLDLLEARIRTDMPELSIVGNSKPRACERSRVAEQLRASNIKDTTE